MTGVDALCWPLARLGEGLAALARRAGLRPAAEAPALPDEVVAAGEVEDWIDWAGARLGIEAEAVEATLPAIEAMLLRAGPALVRLRDARGAPAFVLLLGRRGRRLRLIAPDLAVRSSSVDALRDALCARHEAPLAAEVERLLDAAGVPLRRRPHARRLLYAERLATTPVGGVFLLRSPAAGDFWRRLVHARLPRRVGWLVVLLVVLYALEIAGWALIGGAALDGRLDLGWLGAWVLLVLTLVPLRVASGWLNASFALDAGRLLKQRLLAGALRLDLDAVRTLGAGEVLGRVMESQALESLALNGGLAVLVALIELAFAAWVLAHGAAGPLHLAVLTGWLAAAAALAWRFHGRLRRWTATRLALTNDLVERMVGHRTRLAQERPQRRDADEDASIHDYLLRSQALDRAVAPVAALAPGGWIVLGLLGLAPAFVGAGAGAGGLAISLGGLLFAHRALNGVAAGLAALSRAAIAWQQVGPVFGAAARAEAAGAYVGGARLAALAQPAAGAPLVDASRIVFRYRAEGEPVLRGVDLAIGGADRVLLEGASGGGKSTLAALLVGLRRPASGLLLLGGLDRHTLGDGWHRLATEAPQFHENHVFGASLGFNLLLGRPWPAGDDALAEARAVCDELGLGALVDRMPGGLEQRVGETGWQLSHGERSRLFLARALLQRAPLTILDESFAALDPETLKTCLDCALRRARALVVIAHP